MPVKPLTSRRSVSPFGLKEPIPSVFQSLEAVFATHFLTPTDSATDELKTLADAHAVPLVLTEIYEAPSGDSPELNNICQYLLRFKPEWEQQGVSEELYSALEKIFETKTELFLIDHYDQAQCEKMGWPDQYRNVVLFGKERDALVGGFFEPFSQNNPGRFSALINKWVESGNPDRLLHFLDFCLGSKRPTFEHYLLFTHASLARVLRNKALLKNMLEKVTPIIKKLPAAESWLSEVKTILEI